MTFIGKLLRGAKGIGIGLINTAIPNLKANIESEIGGEGKAHVSTSVTSWLYAAIAFVSTAWVIYSLLTGKDPATIKEEIDLINSAVN